MPPGQQPQHPGPHPRHRMTPESRTRDEVLFVCPHPGCGRRLVVQRSGGVVVLDRGDFFALHSGGTEGLRTSAALDR